MSVQLWFSTDLNQLGPVAVSPGTGLNWFYNTKSSLLTNFYFVLNETNYMIPCIRIIVDWGQAMRRLFS